jgi:hypothetical protein
METSETISANPRGWPPLRFREFSRDDFSESAWDALQCASGISGEALAFRQQKLTGIAFLIRGILTVGVESSDGGSVTKAAVDALENLTAPKKVNPARVSPKYRGHDGPFSPIARELVSVARSIAEQTGSASRIDDRHLLAALVGAGVRPQTLSALRRVWNGAYDIAPEALWAPILAAIERNLKGG